MAKTFKDAMRDVAVETFTGWALGAAMYALARGWTFRQWAICTAFTFPTYVFIRTAITMAASRPSLKEGSEQE